MGRVLIQIVPALPPATNGVGDYALAVACAMRREYGLETLFLVGNERWRGPAEVEGFAVRKVAARSAEALVAAVDGACRAAGETDALLQLSGYGYSGRGCPFWLLQGLKRWRAMQKDARLVTMFHELYASAPPWRSTFWVSPAQKMVVAGIARQSQVAVTNIELHRGRLEGFDSGKRGGIEKLAVPSNVGEPAVPGELGARDRSMVVFGQSGTRKRSYEIRWAALQRACEQLGIREIHDVGAGFDGIPDMVGGIPVRKHGVMEARSLSALLSASMAGFVDYFPGYYGKSGVFAAYCAHRMVAVTPEDARSEGDGIERGVHYYSVAEKAKGKNGAEVVPANPQAMADAGWQWYQGHTVESHARVFAAALRS